MSFAEDVKNELCRYENPDSLCEKIEASSLLRVGGTVLVGSETAVGIRISTANNAVARRVLRIVKNNFYLHTSVVVRRGLNLRKKNMYTLTVEPTPQGMAVMEELKLWPSEAIIPAEWLRPLENRRAFLRGAFLGGGSVNKPQSDYHLEFMTSDKLYAERIVSVLRQFRITARITDRKGEYIVYVKEGDGVTTCLQVMGASGAMMEFEKVRIVKEMRNQVNRQVNCETANLQKTVDAAVRQLNSIRRIQKYMTLAKLPPKLLEVAQARLDQPSASLQDLEDYFGGTISKSGINHRLKKLESIAAELVGFE